MDPLSIGLAFANTKGGAALLGGVGSGLGSTPPAGPSSATGGAYGSGLDGSGWSVNFSGMQSTASNQDKSGGVPGLLGGSGVSAGVPWYVWAGLGVVVLWRLKKSSR